MRPSDWPSPSSLGPVPWKKCVLKGALLGLASLSALAQSPLDLEPEPTSAPDLIFKLSGKTDSTQGQEYQGKVTWVASKALILALSGDRSNLAFTTQSPSPDGNATTTTTTSLGGAYAFGLFELGLQVDRSAMSDLLSSQRYYLQPALDGGTWRLGLEFSTRKTDFDRLQFTGRTINTPSGPVTVSGYADLNISDTGLGINWELSGEVWRCFGSYTRYSYGSFEGNTDVTRIWDANGRVTPEVFKALAGRLIDRLEHLSATTLSRKAALLDSEATVGLEANLRKARWVLDINQDVDHLTSEVSDTYTGRAGWKVSPTFLLEVQLGATRSEAFGTDRFAGLALIFRTRPRF